MREISPRSPIQLLLLFVVVSYAVVLIGAPLGAIAQGAFSKGIPTLINAVTNADVIYAFRVTFLLALGAALVNTLGGMALAWVLVRHRFRGRGLVDALVSAPFVVSPVIVGYVLIVLFGRNGWIAIPGVQIAFALPGMLLATIFVSMPFVAREAMPMLQALGPEQEEAALTLGASRWGTFWRVVFPEIRTGLLYGIVLTFARSVGEFGAVIVIGGGVARLSETATIYVFRALNDRNQIGAYGVSIILAAFSIGILVVMDLLRRRSAQRYAKRVVAK